MLVHRASYLRLHSAARRVVRTNPQRFHAHCAAPSCVRRYADYDYASFRQTFLMTNISLPKNSTSSRRLLQTSEDITHSELQARRKLQGSSTDWRYLSVLTPVKNQGRQV